MALLKQYLEKSCAQYPDNYALDINNELFTYTNIYRLASIFSNGLTSRKIHVSSRIAIWLPKIPELYISVLGSIIHSSTYIPIDISAPALRANYIIRDSGAEVVVCRESDYQQLPKDSSSFVKLFILLRDDHNDFTIRGDIFTEWGEFLEKATSLPATYSSDNQSEEDIAYILYTSGSTGNPKGVAISHRAASAFVEWSSSLVKLNSSDRVSNHASLSFDLSIFDIFSTLYSGATIVPLPNWGVNSGYSLCRFIKEKKISIWYSVPTLLARIAHSQSEKEFDLSCLRVAIFAGEPFHKPDLIKLHQAIPNATLYNWYGPTETNVCTYHLITNSDLNNIHEIPIGIPCPYAKIKVVLDTESLTGELLVSGDSLMSGYWRNNKLDETIFIHGLEIDESYYPTGDIVTFENDKLSYKGRKDQQVKRHGYRIELGEIENNISSLGGIAEVSVIFKDPNIIAFIVKNAENNIPGTNNLKSLLLKSIPPYMLPDKIVFTDHIPKNDRGKVDRIKLKAMSNQSL